MYHRGLGFDKLVNKVIGRRSSESSIQELPKTGANRRNSLSNPVIIIQESEDMLKHGEGRRLRAHSTSLIHSHKGILRSRSRTSFSGKKQTKDLVQQETLHVILKKLAHILEDLGLQKHIPLKTVHGNSGEGRSKSIQMYVANTNDCIYLPAASSASFTYEDDENGGIPQERRRSDFSSRASVNDSQSEQASERTAAEGSVNLERDPSIPSSINSSLEGIPSSASLNQRMGSFKSPNYLCTKVDAETPIPHTFAVIIELKKETAVKDVNIEFSSMTNILWPTGDSYNRTYARDRFKIGSLKWNFKLSDAYYYINSSNTNDIKHEKYSSEDFAGITKEYKLYNVHDVAEGRSLDNSSSTSFFSEHFESSNNASNAHTDSYKEGFYVFILPILLPEHIPATIVSINGSLNHFLTIKLNKSGEKLNRKSRISACYELPMVRTPPLIANTTSDKPIYVNRVWNDALHYIITFPKKYVPLGSEHQINVKLVPLVKNIIVKRIKFNVLERITYVSRDLSKEYDFDNDDPFYSRMPPSEGKVRERVVPVCELKAKNKNNSYSSSVPYKEERIRCPNNNLLFSCYENYTENGKNLSPDDPLSKPGYKSDDLLVASPLQINIALPFLTVKSDKTILTSSLDAENIQRRLSMASRSASPSTHRSSSAVALQNNFYPPSSPIIGALETNITHDHSDLHLLRYESENETFPLETSEYMPHDHNSQENIQQGYTTISKALYPDSNFRHIQIYHRLQVCFRISKPDPKDSYKMHHYEVVVDTPLVLLSAKCNEESIQLPRYDEIDVMGSSLPSNPSVSFRRPGFEGNGLSIRPLYDEDEPLPTFEEAITSVSSPVIRSTSITEDNLSIASYPNTPAPAYEADERNSGNNDEYQDLSEVPNIDELVNNSSSSNVTLNYPTIKSSLISSFAPSNSNENSSISNKSSEASSKSSKLELKLSDDSITGNEDVPSKASICDSNANSQDEELSLEVSREPFGSASLVHNVTDSSSITANQVDTEVSNMTSLNSEYKNLEHKEDCNNERDDQFSIFTRDSEFDQKLPLLENPSVEEVRLSSTSSNASSSLKQVPTKSSFDNRSVLTNTSYQPQEIYRTYQ